ncbi:hypothetical protein ElyMa_003484400 [Elysia marginata]|uniref:Uncharacterized protein n=1 Tax=Elysia marginata TaxID=1093978 RepID=A0AAV4ED26_9GAST|nr:hypothetical protein ElyMa_003484400 [Elysia marginata]
MSKSCQVSDSLSDSNIAMATSSTAGSEERKLKLTSSPKRSKQKLQTKSKPSAISKWSMFLNQDDSEDEENSDHIELEDQLSAFD